MDKAEQAYEAAKAEIARVKAAGEDELDLSGEDYRALTTLPPEIADLKGLHTLHLNKTQITDLTPLAALLGLRILFVHNTKIGDLSPIEEIKRLRILDLNNTHITDFAPLSGLTELQRLYLDYTRITDLAPLAGLTGVQTLDLSDTQITDLAPLAGLTRLQTLYLDDTPITDLAPLARLTGVQDLTLRSTKVADLRPIAGLEKLATDGVTGVHFLHTPATARDAKLAELAEIEDDAERARQTLAYLRSLPPWPDPYTPAATPDGSPPKPIGGVPDTPDPDKMPRLVLTRDHRIDLDPVLATEAELGDPIRKRLYDRLPTALDGLLRYSNRYPQLDSPARALRDMIAGPFEDADFLMMHLEIDALTDVKDGQASLPDPEKLDADCLAALAGVLRIAPPITMGHPDIELLEERGRDYQRSRIPESVADAESRIARGLETHELATLRTQEFARRTAAAGPTGRVAEIRRGFSRNTILIMFFIADQATDAAFGHVFGSATVTAAQFLLLHKDAIFATAPTWGQSGFAWTQYVMLRAQQIVDDANRLS